MGNESTARSVSFPAKKYGACRIYNQSHCCGRYDPNGTTPEIVRHLSQCTTWNTPGHQENEITVGTITLKEERRLIGLVIDIDGVSFDFLMDPLGVNTLRQGETKLYRPAHLMFEGRGRAHVIFLCWSSDHSEDGVVFTRNLNAEAAARLRSKLRRSKRQ